MMNQLTQLSPKAVWTFFEEILTVPRPSKKEGKIIAYLQKFAADRKLPCKVDGVGNVLISKPATPGYEGAKGIILQAHLDMVCEKNSDVTFDFENDAIVPSIENGWVKAVGTTLGADCGIGIAAQLAILDDKSIRHGPLECLFTVDEETGLTGAKALEPGFLQGSVLLNLDSEDEGEIFIGCAGGIDTVVQLKYREEPVPVGWFAAKISVSGLLGGHSGDDINKGRANAIKIVNRFLYETGKNLDIRLAIFEGGNLRNAIAREAYAVVLVPSNRKEDLTIQFNEFREVIENEIVISEPKIKLKIESTDLPATVIDQQTQLNLTWALYASPHGVLAMSQRMPGMVETSTNLASVRCKTGHIIEVVTSQRSDLESSKYDAAAMVESVFKLAGANVTHGDGYCGWAPNPSSAVLKGSVELYKDLFGVEPIVRSIHAGLECGLFLEKFPTLDMISFGPTLRGVQSPDERIEIASVDKFWQFLVAILANVR